MLFLLTACVGTSDLDDTSTTDDTGTPPVTPVSLDADLASAPTDVWGCGWAYAVRLSPDADVAVQLVLPEADRFANLDVSYARALTAEESVTVATGLGGDSFQTFDCSDVMEIEEDREVWRATAGELEVEATFLEDRPEWTCNGTDPNPAYAGVITLRDLELEDAAGNGATLTELVIETEIGANFCGG